MAARAFATGRGVRITPQVPIDIGLIEETGVTATAPKPDFPLWLAVLLAGVSVVAIVAGGRRRR
jgi:hypothetical protein